MKLLNSCVLAGLAALILLAPLLAPAGPFAQDRKAALTAPSPAHPLGTDELGRDLWAQFLHGGRTSLMTGSVAAAIALAIAWAVGSLAGWCGGWVDALFMWLAELFLTLPWLYLLIAIRAALPVTLAPETASLTLMMLIALSSWARPARMVRGAVLSERERGWVEAARGFGRSAFDVYRRHVLPSTYGLLAAQLLILIPRFVLAEVTLTFAGAGAGETVPSWGALIVPLKQAYLLREQWWLALPLLLMLIVFTSFALLSRGWRESTGSGGRIN